MDEALCFGWIDSQAKPVDEARYMQFFSRRKPTSGWSKVNKEKVQRLLAAGRVTPAGLAALGTAQRNGSWTLLDDVEALRPPPDLAQALAQDPLAQHHFTSLSRSAKRYWLLRLVQAKRDAPATYWGNPRAGAPTGQPHTLACSKTGGPGL